MIPSLFESMQSVMNNNNNNNNNNGLPSLFDYNFDNNNNNSQSSGGGNSRANVIKMRGLPYSVNVNDIKEFFKPLMPININLLFGDDGRLSGEAEVEFMSQNDINEALKYDRKYIGTRYIELFLNSTDLDSSTNFMNNNDNASSSSIPSLFNSMSFFSSQQYNNNNNYNNSRFNGNRRGLNNRRGRGKKLL